MTKNTHKIPPDKSLMEDIGATSFTLAEAIVELVANSIDARPLDKAGQPARLLRISITVNHDEVSVVDDAIGMTEEVLVNAVRLGAKMDAILGHRKRKGMYGLGLKTAAASIGRYWSVLTRPEEGNNDYFLEFDLAEYASSKTSSLGDWTVDVEVRPRDKKSILGTRRSGTAIVVRKLRARDPMPGAVLQLVGDAYKPHIEAGDVITVNGDAASPTDYRFLSGSRVDINEIISGNNQWRVVGWVALDSQTHNDGKYGFNLYRQDQLIETWDKSWFRAHLMTSRIIGEAHLDYMPVNFNKQGFKTQSEEWLETRRHMTDVLKPVVKASQEASRGRGDETKHKRAVAGMKRAMGAVGQVGPLTAAPEPRDQAGATQGAETAVASRGSKVAADRIIIGDHEIVPSSIVEDFESGVTPWDYIHSDFDGGKRTEVQTVLNSSSVLFKETSDQGVLGILAVADCVTRYLVERCAFPPAQARSLRDQWIHLAIEGTASNKKQSAKEPK